MGVNADGRRELLGLKVGDSESEPFWREFLASLKQRGLTGVQLVVSDAYVGLTKAVGRMVQGCSWQRCRVHVARNLLQTVPKAQQEMVAVALCSVLSQQSKEAVLEQWEQVSAMLAAKLPRAAELLASAREDVLAFRNFPNSHWRKLWSTNLLERVNEEPTRLVGAVLLEQDRHWQLEGRPMFSLDSMAAIPPSAETLPEPDRERAAMP